MGATFYVYRKDTLLYRVCAWEREMPGDLKSDGRDVRMPERQSDRDLYWGPNFRRERGVNVLVCWCLGERTTSLCVCGGGARGGGWLQIKSELSIFEGL